MTTDTAPFEPGNPEGPIDVANEVTLLDLENEETYTARIVSALTVDDILATEDPADEPEGDTTISQPFDFTVRGYIESTANPQIPDSCGIDLTLVLDASGSIQSLKCGRDGSSGGARLPRCTEEHWLVRASDSIRDCHPGVRAPATTIDDAALDPRGRPR